MGSPTNVSGPLKQPSAACSQEECRRQLLPWVPIPESPRESCLDLLVDQPHSLLSILDAQTWLSQVSPRWQGQAVGSNKVMGSRDPAHKPLVQLGKAAAELGSTPVPGDLEQHVWPL